MCVRACACACVRVCVCVRVRVCVLGNCTLLLYILRHNTFNLLLVICYFHEFRYTDHVLANLYRELLHLLLKVNQTILFVYRIVEVLFIDPLN